MTRWLAIGALIAVALVAGVLVSHTLRESGASGTSTGFCRPVARGWHGHVTGVRLTSSRGAFDRAVLAGVNRFRHSQGRRALVRSQRLTWAALYHSRDMHRRGVLEHERAGETFTARFARYSGSSCIAENIAVGFRTASGVVTAWENSPGHRHVMLLEWIRRAGVGSSGSFVTLDASS